MSAAQRRLGICLLSLLAVAWLVCFHRLGAVGVFDLDEGLYSTASRQMLESGDFIVPRIGPDVRFAKPALIYWVQVPFMAVLGFTSLAVRLPSALSILGTALLLWLHGHKVGRFRAGWLAAIVFLCCPLSMVLARQGIIDALLAFCLTLTVYGWARGALGETDAERTRGWLLMGAGIGLSALAKGLLGIVLPGAALVVWLIMERGRAEKPRLPWLAMAFLALLIALPWHILMYRATGHAFIQEYFLSNHVERFTGKKWGHVQPFWFYVPITLAGMFPWSALIPATWWRALRLPDETKTGLRVWALWALAVFAFFSISKSKLPGYILPAFPALAILVGFRLDDLWESKQAPATAESVCLLIFPLLLGLVGLAGGFVGQSWRGQSEVHFLGKPMTASTVETLVFFSPWLLFLGCGFIAGAIALFVLRKEAKHLTAALTAISLIFAVVAIHGGLAKFDREQIQPLHTLARQTLPALDRGESVTIFNLRPRRPSLRYVLGHTAQVTEIEDDDLAKLRASMKAPQGYLIAMASRKLPPLPAQLQLEATSGKWSLYHWTHPTH